MVAVFCTGKQSLNARKCIVSIVVFIRCFFLVARSYELQIEKDHQRKGIGRFLMGVLERLAKHYGMEKLILTVLSNNQNAIDFFTKMRFTPDDTSPTKSEASGYEILSMRLS